MLCVGIALGAAVIYAFTPALPAVVDVKPQVSIGDVTSLIDRLKPLAERPDDDWRGVTVTITGASAAVEIRTKDGNEYKGKGKTLRDAAKMIDSSRIRDALNGWLAP